MKDHQKKQEIHAQVTRGEKISASDLIQLEAWYFEQDEIEKKQITAKPVAYDRTELQKKVLATAEQLTATAQRVQLFIAQNEGLRQEIIHLQHEILAVNPRELA